jgi:hypothetical protein
MKIVKTMTHLEIQKGDTDLYVEKSDDSITLEISFQDTMDYRTNIINLTKEEVLKVIESLQKMVE